MRHIVAWLVATLVLLAVMGLYVVQASAGGTFQGTTGNDVIHGNTLSPAASAIYGLAGDDRIWGGRGSDHVFGGPGDDRLHNFHPGSGSLSGGGGWDVCVIGTHGNVTVHCEVVEYR